MHNLNHLLINRIIFQNYYFHIYKLLFEYGVCIILLESLLDNIFTYYVFLYLLKAFFRENIFSRNFLHKILIKIWFFKFSLIKVHHELYLSFMILCRNSKYHISLFFGLFDIFDDTYRVIKKKKCILNTLFPVCIHFKS